LSTGQALPTDRYYLMPEAIMSDAGYPPDDWQAKLLREQRTQTLMCASRQAGKSLVTAALALRTAFLEPRSLVLLISRSQRQSGDLFQDKVLRLWNDLGRPLAADSPTQLTLTLSNGSRILSLPGDEETIRGYSGPRLIVIDEASRTPDALYYSVTPMLAVSKGCLVCLSTPYGRRGWFYEEWEHGGDDWYRVKITAEQCPRITADFLKREERRLGPRWYRQEYECSFESAEDAVFSYEEVMACKDDSIKPLFAEDLSPYYLDETEPAPPQPQWPANVCRRCGLKRMLSDLDEWGMCRLCRT
jgi:hypothetical protein